MPTPPTSAQHDPAGAGALGGSGDAPKIDIAGVSVSFAGPGTSVRHDAVTDISTTIQPGEFVSLIGPSGCGKTTLINAIAGMVPTSRGSLAIDGTPVRGIQHEKVAFMLARDALLPWRTAFANVRLALEVGAGAQHPAADARSRELLALVGLEGKEDFYPGQLSQGMRQRVALARTLAADREILLMDEPFAALDAQTRTLIGAEFSRIWEGRRKTVVLVTHDLTEAIALADRVLVMSSGPGRIVADHRITLPRPRVILDLPADETFQQLYRTLWMQLRPSLEEA